ncbi:PPC domain-containing protein, partial [Winogradskyella algicola]|uniref:PPC domain-containing protein n=1 Tax=Winogradskyella algicola TaxID=2575815 RepID=UPI002938D138
VMAGTVVAGPYNSGDTVTLTVDATDDACDADLGEFTFTCPEPAPANDLCADAEMVACGDTVMGDTTAATSDSEQAYCGTSAPSATNGGVWYAFMGDGSDVTFDLSGSSFDTKIFVYTGVCDDLTCLDGDDDGGDSTTSSITVESMAGTTYYVYVSGFGSNRGAYTMSVSCEAPPQAPANDDCSGALPLDCGATVTGSTEGATASGLDAECDGFASSDAFDLFYTFEADGTSSYTLSLDDATGGFAFDGVMFVYSGPCDDLTSLACSDSGSPEEITLDALSAGTYTVRIFDYFGTADFTLDLTCETPDPCAGPLPQLTWTGTMDTNWENTGNWDNNEAPGLMVFADVTIPMGAPNYPVLTVGQDLYISECSTVTVEDGASLGVSPNVEVTNDGIVANDGTVTFESDATGSAYIGSGMGMFMGDFTVERYIPAKRAYRQLGTPVTTSTPISDNWQQDTHITGPAGNTDGFDVTFTGNPSAYIFDNIGYEYVELTNTNATNLIPGTMYHILIRGDRNTDLGDNDATPSETTLHATGELTAENVGSQMIAVNVPEQRFIAVGNPFQSQIDMNTVLTTGSTNINPNFYWVWDPTLGIRGAYTAIMAATGTASTAGSDANQYLQAGQAGWVYTAAAGQSSVIFDQTSKNNSGFETSTFTDNGGSTSLSQLRLSLYESSAFANNDTATDGVLILFGANGNNG